MLKKIFQAIYRKIVNCILEKELRNYGLVIIRFFPGHRCPDRIIYKQTLLSLLYKLKLCSKENFELRITANGQIMLNF